MSETEKEKELEELRKRCEDLERQQRAAERERSSLPKTTALCARQQGDVRHPPLLPVGSPPALGRLLLAGQLTRPDLQGRWVKVCRILAVLLVIVRCFAV